MITIQEGGIASTVQDRGRFGHYHIGMPPSGAMDKYAHTIANYLVDNDADYLIGLRVAQNTRHTMAVSQRISGLAAGTYNVGLCYQATAAQAGGWNSNDWVNNVVFVTQN